MKAMIRNELVLLYRLGSEKEKGRQVRQLLERYGICAEDIGEPELGQPLDWWVANRGGDKTYIPYEGEPFAEEVVVFSGITGKRLNQLLRDLKSIPAGAVALKAVVTQHNKTWPARALFEELRKEHRIMSRRGDLASQIKKWEALTQREGNSASEELIAALAQAKVLWKQGEEGTFNSYDQAIEKLRQAGEGYLSQEGL